MDKPSQIKVCGICNTRVADGLMGYSCSVCYRKSMFEKLPAGEKFKALLEVVPKRYAGAEISHLPKSLQAVFMKEIDDGVLLWGTPGSGKTYALASLAKKYVSEGYTVARIHYEMLCLKLRDTFNPNAKKTEWQILEPLLNIDKLFIEDVGASHRLGKQESDHSVRTFLVLLDMRMERCLPTFITSNKSVENIGESFDNRISDRLTLFNVFAMKAESKRAK